MIKVSHDYLVGFIIIILFYIGLAIIDFNVPFQVKSQSLEILPLRWQHLPTFTWVNLLYHHLSHKTEYHHFRNKVSFKLLHLKNYIVVLKRLRKGDKA